MWVAQVRRALWRPRRARCQRGELIHVNGPRAGRAKPMEMMGAVGGTDRKKRQQAGKLATCSLWDNFQFVTCERWSTASLGEPSHRNEGFGLQEIDMFIRSADATATRGGRALCMRLRGSPVTALASTV